MTPDRPEIWLRGPVDGVPAELQPVADALLQAREEVEALMIDFPESLLWTQPAGVASVGFHLQNLCGVVDRLFTYARGNLLDEAQSEALRGEGQPDGNSGGVEQLVQRFRAQVERALDQLRTTDVTTLHETRPVGRARLPSTVLGLLSHAAEHVHRHLGQLLLLPGYSDKLAHGRGLIDTDLNLEAAREAFEVGARARRAIDEVDFSLRIRT